MRQKNLIAVAVAGALCVLAAPLVAGAVIDNRANDVVALGADPLLAVESNRSGIIERLVAEHSAALAANGIAESAFRQALAALRADQLLAAALVNTLQEISAIVAAPTAAASVRARYIAVAPSSILAALPAADAYLVRYGDSLTVVKAAQLQLDADTQLVGYFQTGSAAMVVQATGGAGYSPKDGAGSGANTWIGYVAGSNVASGPGSAVAAGTFNTASGQGAFVGAGQSNVASGTSSLVLGGFDNQATVIDAMVGAGAGNRATGARSVVVGGGYNLASGQWSFIGGGGRQTGGGAAGTNVEDHVASGDFSTIGGGQGNRAGGFASTVGGGNRNTASTSISTIGGGDRNVASALASTVGGGFGNTVSGAYSAVAGGVANIASGSESFVAGADGDANLSRCGILAFWVGSQSFNCLGVSEIVRVGANHGFSVDYSSQRVDGGGTRWIAIGDTVAGQTIATWTGASLSDGGVWTNASDRALKDDFTAVDPRDVLQRVAALPILRWHYKSERPGVTHIGPMAQDFHAAFGLGNSDKAIGTVDADGVALAAIQGLYQEVRDRDAKLASQQRQLSTQQQHIAALKQQIGELAAAQLQLHAVAAVVVKLQQEVASLRPARVVAASR